MRHLPGKLDDIDNEWLQGLVIHTLSNGADKQTRRYDDSCQPSFLATDAIVYLREIGVQHLELDVCPLWIK